ncbi:hypothetical protein F4827_001968 [Paraburkholderia bannensis]|uniref:Uncharacterized protein n=1 Tax=Paraburkholderia bannensis TaxID=765414 RepID=A0A7W9WQI2_9BURK|nr:MULTISPECIES: hypothetical protein [Paraburkholderia]MBB3261566.1 hypothetical protein [Paraburkholderia sp. WP4_3_2]MBB6102120.1 hypothetical protein [Paraburkholderia bannensis]
MASFKRILLCCDASRERKELALECRAQTQLLAALDEAPLPWRGLRNGASKRRANLRWPHRRRNRAGVDVGKPKCVLLGRSSSRSGHEGRSGGLDSGIVGRGSRRED